MSQKQTYDKCKFFRSKEYCPQINNETMKLVNQDFPESHTGSPITLFRIPKKEEINKICNECDSFTQG